MSDSNAQEPTMEEILASIRRIISEDDAPAATAVEAAEEPADEPQAAPPEPEPILAAAPEPEPEPEPAVEAEVEDDDVLDLTDPEPAPAPEPAPIAAIGDIEAFAPPPRSAPAPAPAPAPAMSFDLDQDDDDQVDGLSSPPTADIAASAFTQLSRTLAMPAEGRTLEDVVREMLRPMLKDWLDRNLPGIVETAVQSEVERISRLRRF